MKKADAEKKAESERKKVAITIIVLIIALLFAVVLLIMQSIVSEGQEKRLAEYEQIIKELKAENEKSQETQTDNINETEATNDANDDYSKYDVAKIIKADTLNGNIGDHVRGKADSKVVVVEYADLSCPGCASMATFMDKIYDEYKNQVAFVYRHYPLQDHVNSRPAAKAAESAAKQGYYWEMIDALFEKREDWIYASGQPLTSALVRIFKKVAPNGNEAQFRTDMEDANVARKISFDREIGYRVSGVQATPSIYVNGKLVSMMSGSATFQSVSNDIRNRINEELKK